jgi:hypothetical protein
MSLTNLQMNRSQRVVTINGQEYIYKMLPAFVAFDVGSKLIEIFGPAIGSAIDGVQRSDYVLPDESTFWSELMIHLSRSLNGVSMSEVAQTVLPEVYINSSTKIDINEYFTGNIKDFKSLLFDALKENFGDLFLELLQSRGLEIHTWEDLKKLTQPVQRQEQSEEESSLNPQ